MFTVNLKLEDPGGALSRLNLLSELSFTEETWWGTQQRLYKFMKDRVASIKKRNVSKKTYQWRKREAAKNSTVETYVGMRSPVLFNYKVGMRTGIFLNTLSNSLLPGIYDAVSINEQGTKNGMYVYMLNSEAFHRHYPDAFEDYLIGRGIIGKDEGLAGVDDSQAQSLLDTLSESVANHLTASWYSNVG